MIIEPFKKYVVNCEDVRGNFKGYWIKEIILLEESQNPTAVGKPPLFSPGNDLLADFSDDEDDPDFWEECPQCGEYIGIDGQCHSCGFDWDSCYGD